MTYEEYFNSFKKRFENADVSHINEHLAFQFNIEDAQAGGIFYVEVKDGKLYIEPYEYNDRDALFVCSPQLLDKIVEKKQDPVTAYLTHKLKVEGDVGKALKLKELLP